MNLLVALSAFSNVRGALRPLAQCLRMLARVFASKHSLASRERYLPFLCTSRMSRTFFTLTVTASLAKCKAPTCCCQLASALRSPDVAFQAAKRGSELLVFSDPGGHAKEKGSVARVHCDDGGSGSAKLCAYVGS